MEYVYIPFANDEGLKRLARSWTGNRPIFDYGQSRPLRDVTADDTVFVTAHGRPGMARAKGTAPDSKPGSPPPPPRAALNAMQLVERIQMAGLKRDVATKIVLTICHGAKGGVESFAAQVAEAASSRGCAWSFEGYTTVTTVAGPSGEPLGMLRAPVAPDASRKEKHRAARIIDPKSAKKRVTTKKKVVKKKVVKKKVAKKKR